MKKRRPLWVTVLLELVVPVSFAGIGGWLLVHTLTTPNLPEYQGGTDLLWGGVLTLVGLGTLWEWCKMVARYRREGAFAEDARERAQDGEHEE